MGRQQPHPVGLGTPDLLGLTLRVLGSPRRLRVVEGQNQVWG